MTLNKDIRFTEFGYNKIIIISAIINGLEYSYHHNVLINKKTTFLMYWNSVKDSIKQDFGEGYGVIIKFKLETNSITNTYLLYAVAKLRH